MKQPVDIVEFTVVDHDLIRSSIVLPPWMENEEARKESLDDNEIDALRMDHKNIRKIDFLTGLDNLKKLQLDNNALVKIENISHLKNLTWLDLSFNFIKVIEGLDELVHLTDISLFNNLISEIKNMDNQTKLQCISLGNNKIKTIESLSYLIRFRKLQMVTLAGNQVCKDAEYKPYVLAHLKHLRYLDYRMVDPAAVQTAKEAYQEDLLDLEEKDLREDAEIEEADKAMETHLLLEAANVAGIDKFFDFLFDNDPEQQKYTVVTSLFQPQGEYRDQLAGHTEEFKAYMLEQNTIKKSEKGEYNKGLGAFKNNIEQRSIKLINDFELRKKHCIRWARINVDTESEQVIAEKLGALKTENITLKKDLLALELDLVDTLTAVIEAFQGKYGQIIDNVRKEAQEFYGHIRSLEDNYHEAVCAIASNELEKFSGDPDEFEEDVKNVLSDKDTFMAALQASHDLRINRIDQREDQVTSRELKEKIDVDKGEMRREHDRNRDRITEIIGLIGRNNAEIRDLYGELGVED